jgi:peptide deformylase
MAILKIRKYGDPVLRQKSKPVKEINKEIKKLIEDMFETMYAAPGIGLAACQVGHALKLCVIDAKPEGKRTPMVFINPKIVFKKGKAIEEEGCLSFPGLTQAIKRYKNIRVEAINEKGFPVVVEADDMLSRVIQHEFDHIDSKVFLDRLSWWKRLKAEKEIKKRIKQGNW